MRNRIRNTFFLLLFLLPLIVINLGFYKAAEIYIYWHDNDQQSLAAQKLGQITATLDFSQQLVNNAERFFIKLTGLAETSSKKFLESHSWQETASRVFGPPFPRYELWIFAFDNQNGKSQSIFNNAEKVVSRRSMEMIFSGLVQARLGLPREQYVKKRSEKLIKKVFGSGAETELLAHKHKGISTPVIYNSIPSFLVWEMKKIKPECSIGMFLVIPRNQNIEKASLQMAAKSSGLGSELPGGFIKLFESASSDSFFPGSLKSFSPFTRWRKTVPLCNDKVLLKWETEGFPWGEKLGAYRLYTRILTAHRHLLFVLLPEIDLQKPHRLLFAFNLMYGAIFTLLFLKGVILNKWPGYSLRGRFFLIFFLAVTLPLVLYATASATYLFDRYKADEKMTEALLEASLRDFDLGKEQIEKDYLKAFNKSIHDSEVKKNLRDNHFSASDKLMRDISRHFDSASTRLPLAGIAITDLEGNHIHTLKGSIPDSEFSSLVDFYGYNLTMNLRRKVRSEEPDFCLPELKVDETDTIAHQAYGKNENSIDKELALFQGQIFRTRYGRGKIVILHEFIQIDGKSRFVLITSWLDEEVDTNVLARSANLLALKNPEISVVGFKDFAEGRKLAFQPHRSFNKKRLSQFARFADAAFSSKVGMVQTVEGEMSLVAYASPKFEKTVLVAGLNNKENHKNNLIRFLALLILFVLSLLILLVSGLITYYRIIYPLENSKKTLDQVILGHFSFSGDTTRADELGLMNAEFSRMITGLEERHKLASILSEHAVEAISFEDNSLVDKRFNAVVLVSDIRSFTTMCETHTPNDITAMLNSHFAEMAKIIVLHGGQVHKFIGDAIEAVFEEREEGMKTASLRACKASVMMLKRLQEMNLQRQASGRFTYEIGIGLSAGEIIGGETGSLESRLEYALLGQPFRVAEKLEVFTRQVQGFPLVIDQFVYNEVSKSKSEFSHHELADMPAFSLEKISPDWLESDQKRNNLFFQDQQDKLRNKEYAETNVNSNNTLGRRFARYKSLVFIVGLFGILFPVFAWLNSESLDTVKQNKQRFAALQKRIDQCFTKLQVNDLQPFVGDVLQNEADAITQRMSWASDTFLPSELKESSEVMLDKLKVMGLEPSQFLVIANKNAAGHEAFNDLLVFKGSERNKPGLTRLAQQIVQRMNSGDASIDEIRNEMQSLIGTEQRLDFIYNELHARVYPVVRHGVDEYLYWQPLLQRNSRFVRDFSKQNPAQTLRGRPPSEALRVVGALLISLEVSKVRKNLLNLLKSFLSAEKIEFKISSGGKVLAASKNFPTGSFAVSSQELNSEWLRQKKNSKIGDLNFNIQLALPLKQNTGLNWKHLLPVAIFVLALTLIWHSTLYREKYIATSFAWQLWLGLFAASLVPVSAVFLLNEWNAWDRKGLSMGLERIRLLEEIDKLERRQFFDDLNNWEKIHNFSNDSELLDKIKQVDGNADVLRSGQLKTAIRQKAEGINFNEVRIVSVNGWQTVVKNHQQNRQTAEFNQFLQSFFKNYFADLGSKATIDSKEKMATAVKDELTRDAGLDMFRNLFGSDTYFAMMHGLNHQINIFAHTGVACLKVIPVPTFLQPPLLYYWIFVDRYNQALRRICYHARCNFPIYTDAQSMYGAVKQVTAGGWVPQLVDYARWAVATKTPMNYREKINGSNFQVEARIGRYNTAMMLFGLIPEDLILEQVDENRRKLQALLLLSLLIIVLMSLVLAFDFIVPIRQLTYGARKVSEQSYQYRIKSERNDELGLLLQTFNRMTRGLQEKELMGKMVSNSARYYTSDTEGVSNAEKGISLDVSVVYIAVPEFSMFVDSMGPVELIAELKEHIDQVCKIILANGGDIDKLMGEKVLAVFYDEKGLKHGVNSAVAAIEQIRLAERQGRLRFPVTVGLHSGEVLAGLLGIGADRDFTLIGDTVNTAARISSQASLLPRERFLISQVSADLQSNKKVELRDFGEVELKGKAGTMKLYQLFFRG